MIRTKQQAADLVLVVLTVIIGIISYILNLGWIRVIFIIPFLAYNTIIMVSGIIYVLTSRKEGALKQRKAFYLGLLTYILFNVFLFDGGDIGPAYCFFGLIKIYGNGSFFYYTSIISLIISLICIILNIKAITSNKAEV